MSDDQTVWSKTLLDGFVLGMKDGNQPDEWIKEQAGELKGRGMSYDYMYKVLLKDVGDAAASRFQSVLGDAITQTAVQKDKKGLFGRLFS